MVIGVGTGGLIQGEADDVEGVIGMEAVNGIDGRIGRGDGG